MIIFAARRNDQIPRQSPDISLAGHHRDNLVGVLPNVGWLHLKREPFANTYRAGDLTPNPQSLS